jgi:dCTP diphosphatase
MTSSVNLSSGGPSEPDGPSQTSLAELQQLIRVFCDEREWDQFHNPKDLSISLALEAAEVMEHFQWKDVTEMATHVKEHSEDVADELADVFYWVLLLANKLDIDLIVAFQRKMKKNEAKYPVAKARGSHKKYTELAD